VKRIELPRETDSDSIECMRRMLWRLHKVRHPNLVHLQGAVCRPSCISLIQQFCAGGCVFELLHNSQAPLPNLQKVKILQDTVQAMCYLHGLQPPVINEDLKSLNLMLVETISSTRGVPHVRISDFGTRQGLDDYAGVRQTDARSMCLWCAPEVLTSHVHTMKTDVYAFGIIMFETLLRRLPFEGLDDRSLRIAITQGVPPETGLQGTPDALHELMASCWGADPKTRPTFFEVGRILRFAESDIVSI